MSLDDPVADSNHKHADSIECTNCLTTLILEGETVLPHDVISDRAAIEAVRRHHQAALQADEDAVQAHLPQPQCRAMKLAREKGGSSTLTTIPTAEHGFFLQ